MNTLIDTLLHAAYGQSGAGTASLVPWSQSDRRFGGELSAFNCLLGFITVSENEGDPAILPGRVYRLMCGAGFSVKEILLSWDLATRAGYVETVGPAVHFLTDLGRTRGKEVSARFESRGDRSDGGGRE